jgi:hypothetical protein
VHNKEKAMTDAPLEKVAGNPQVQAIVQVYHPPGAVVTQDPVTEDHTISVPDAKGDFHTAHIPGEVIKKGLWGHVGDEVKKVVEKAGHEVHAEITWMSDFGR